MVPSSAAKAHAPSSSAGSSTDYYILIADPDRKFLESVEAEGNESVLPPVLVSSPQDAERAIKDQDQVYAAIFINPVISGKGGVNLIRLAHEHRPGVPVFLLYTGNAPFTTRELTRLAVHQALLKPLSYNTMTELISPEIFKAGSLEANPLLEPPSDEDRSFVAVPIQHFFSGMKSFFDVYVRLTSGRYLKILPANESFTSERLYQYLEKGAQHFFVSRTSHDRCISYCDTLAAVLLNNNDVSVEMKIAQALHEGQEILQSVRENGVDELHCEYATAFIDHVRKLIPKNEKDQVSVVNNFLTNVTAYEHAVSTTFIASLLALPLKIQADSAFHTVGLASMLHDIGLAKMPPAVQSEDESKMTPEEVEMFHSHPAVGAEMLKDLRYVDSAVTQAIMQHHERRTGKGFPKGLKAGQINRVAEIIGISDEFVKRFASYDRLRKEQPGFDPLESMKDVVNDFSEPIVEAFLKIFKPGFQLDETVADKEKTKAGKASDKKKKSKK